MTDITPTETTADAATDKAHELISSARVEGTPVFDRAGDKLGTVHSVMIHKRSGRVAYALLAFGGFLGVPSRVHPIPWEKLAYDTGRHGYVVDLTREILADAPTLSVDAAERPSERGYEEALFGYYGATMFW